MKTFNKCTYINAKMGPWTIKCFIKMSDCPIRRDTFTTFLLTSLDQQLKKSCDAVMSQVAQNIHRLEVELESGGNLRYEQGTPSQTWLVSSSPGPYYDVIPCLCTYRYCSCVDLVNSRLSSYDVLVSSVLGLMRLSRYKSPIMNKILNLLIETIGDLL